jgi:tetratricopeptide (TPR) repeat protein
MMLAGRGRVVEGEAELREGLDLIARFRRDDPDAVGYRRVEGFLTHELARCRLDSGRYKEALDHDIAAAKTFLSLEGQGRPTLLDVLYLAFALRGQAAALRELGKPGDALAPLTEAVGRLKGSGADDNNTRFVLARVLIERGRARADASDPDGAEADFTEALRLLDRLRADEPEVAAYPREWAAARNGRGAVRASGDRPRRDAADDDFRAARQAIEPQATRPGDNAAPSDLLQLARALAGLGRLARDRGAPDDAHRLLGDARKPLEQSLNVNRADLVPRRELERLDAEIRALGH